jgi:hypothetical protein
MRKMLLRKVPFSSSSSSRAARTPSRLQHARGALFRHVVCCGSTPGPQAAIWSSHVSRRMNLANAVDDAVDNSLAAARVAVGLAQECEPDLAIVFLSSAFAEEWSSTLVPALRKRLPSLKRVIGCTGFGVIGGSVRSAEEVENTPAISLTLARLPEVCCMHACMHAWGRMESHGVAWQPCGHCCPSCIPSDVSLTLISLPQADIRLVHVAGHNLPSADAPQSVWLDLLGLPDQLPDPAQQPISLVILADPSFRGVQVGQSTSMGEGADRLDLG